MSIATSRRQIEWLAAARSSDEGGYQMTGDHFVSGHSVRGTGVSRSFLLHRRSRLPWGSRASPERLYGATRHGRMLRVMLCFSLHFSCRHKR